MKTKQPIYPPYRLAMFPPCPWRALGAVFVVLCIATALYLAAR